MLATYAPTPPPLAPVPVTPLWQWDTTGQIPVVTGFPGGLNNTYQPTKTGLLPPDLQNFIGVPLQYYGNPSVPVASSDLINWLRYAEDRIEQQTSILLCQTWIAAPASPNGVASSSIGITVNNPNGMQVQGIDYDLGEPAYDFIFNRAQDPGWMYQTLRHRPVQSMAYGVSGVGPGFGAVGSYATIGQTAVKNIAFMYPLLNVFTRIPTNWVVEDRNFGLIRLVPATNVQMLPLYSMQLAFMGFSENVPGAQWYQYTAGLTPFDYKTQFSFMKELVLAEAALTALNAIHGTINLGAESYKTLVDGLNWNATYPKSGPFGPLIAQFEKRRAYLMKIARDMVAGPFVGVI